MFIVEKAQIAFINNSEEGLIYDSLKLAQLIREEFITEEGVEPTIAKSHGFKDYPKVTVRGENYSVNASELRLDLHIHPKGIAGEDVGDGKNILKQINKSIKGVITISKKLELTATRLGVSVRMVSDVENAPREIMKKIGSLSLSKDPYEAYFGVTERKSGSAGIVNYVKQYAQVGSGAKREKDKLLVSLDANTPPEESIDPVVEYDAVLSALSNQIKEMIVETKTLFNNGGQE